MGIGRGSDAERDEFEVTGTAADGAEQEEEDDGKDDDTEEADDVLPSGFHRIPIVPPETEEDRVLMEQERECLHLLLHARKLLSSLIFQQEELDREAREERARLLEKEKIERGNLSTQEIQAILQKSQPGEDETDFVAEIQELKKQLVIEVRKNHVLDRDLARLDKKIALLIKNRGNIQAIEHMSKTKKRTKKDNQLHQTLELGGKKIENYQDLFYLLQTEPRYLARMVYLVSPEQMESFLDTTILTLFGDAFSPREEFLLLRLFQLAIEHEISVIKNVGDFLQVETVVPKMIIAYNKRKKGIEYLQQAIGPVLTEVLSQYLDKDKDAITNARVYMETNPIQVLNALISEQEIRSGQRSTIDRNVTAEQAMETPEVRDIVNKNLSDLEACCKMFLDAIFKWQDDLPYGIRWICKQLHMLVSKALPDTTHEDILKLTGFFVFYRFINVAIVNPDTKEYNLIGRQISPFTQKSLATVARVLQNVFHFRPFGADQPYLQPLNKLIRDYKPKVTEYLNSLVKVDDPEDYLQVNKYMELTQKTKPVIQISLHEILQTHKMIESHIDAVAPDKEDPLRKILADLGVAPNFEIADDDDRDIQLTLTNRFKVDMEEDEESQRLYAETKELLIPILRAVPIKTTIQRLNLLDVLEHGLKYATESKNPSLQSQINKILENIGKLEMAEVLKKDDNYESFVRDVALEVINRSSIREQQKKEILRLHNTLNNLHTHQSYLNEQISSYNKYLEDCKQSFYRPPTKGKKKTERAKPEKLGPFKFSYKELEKKGVIVDSEVPTTSRKLTTFTISSEQPGEFLIVAKVAKIQVETMSLKFEDLLERHYNNIPRLELEQVSLDINMTIHLINNFFRVKK